MKSMTGINRNREFILKERRYKKMKKVLIISTSPRKGSNSETLANELGKGAIKAGHQVEQISLADKNIGFCKGCLACQKTQRCVIRDDADEIAKKMLSADSIVFATPIYFYEMCGQMKTMLDRTNPLFSADYAFRDIYLLMSAADTEESTVAGALKGLQGWIDCFEKAHLAGSIFAGGVDNIGSVIGHKAMQDAYEMGYSL